MELPLFDQVGEVVRTMVPEQGDLRLRAHRRGVKVWFGSSSPARQHFEAQIVPGRLTGNDDAETVIEVGWHSEDVDEAVNESALGALGSGWRGRLGGEPVAGRFIGNDGWRRLSEVWPGVDVDDPDLAFEIAARLVDYIEVLGTDAGAPSPT